jgi:hypothetical protein
MEASTTHLDEPGALISLSIRAVIEEIYLDNIFHHCLRKAQPAEGQDLVRNIQNFAAIKKWFLLKN